MELRALPLSACYSLTLSDILAVTYTHHKKKLCILYTYMDSVGVQIYNNEKKKKKTQHALHFLLLHHIIFINLSSFSDQQCFKKIVTRFQLLYDKIVDLHLFIQIARLAIKET